MSTLHGVLFATLLGASVTAHAGFTDVSIGATVVEVGSSFGQSPDGGGTLAPANSITNGTWLPTGTAWNNNTVFWTNPSDYIQINLNNVYNIYNIAIEGAADYNPHYEISYLNGVEWTPFVSLAATTDGKVLKNGTIFQTGTVGGGLGLNGFSGWMSATAFRIEASGGYNPYDPTSQTATGLYSIGQFQVYGDPQPVPEPGNFALMAAGLGALAFARRRFRQ